jgi:hypothetical protein
MKVELIFKTLARILWVPVSALILLKLTLVFSSSTNSLLYYFTVDTYDTWLTYPAIEIAVVLFVACTAALHLILEVIATFKQHVAGSRLLAHLRYGALSIFLIYLAVLLVFDFAMIEVSKYRIRSYVFESGMSISKPDVYLHNDYRGWCGNGFTDREEDLYFDTAAAGRSEGDPFVRARSLLMMAKVRDLLNGPDPRYYEYLKEGCADPDDVVSSTTKNILSGSRYTCGTIGRPDR